MLYKFSFKRLKKVEWMAQTERKILSFEKQRYWIFYKIY